MWHYFIIFSKGIECFKNLGFFFKSLDFERIKEMRVDGEEGVRVGSE